MKKIYSAYIINKLTHEIVARVEERTEELLLDAITLALPSDDYDYVIEKRRIDAR